MILRIQRHARTIQSPPLTRDTTVHNQLGCHWQWAPSTYTNNQLLISGHQMHYLYRFKGMYLVTSHLLIGSHLTMHGLYQVTSASTLISFGRLLDRHFVVSSVQAPEQLRSLGTSTGPMATYLLPMVPGAASTNHNRLMAGSNSRLAQGSLAPGRISRIG